MVRIVICDDQPIVCDSLAAILGSDPEIEVVGIAHDGAEALVQIAATHPDVVLMDLNMPGMNGVQATRAVAREHPATRVLVLTTYGEESWVVDAIEGGAAGYLLKGTPRAQLVDAVKGTAAGRTHVDPAVAGLLFDRVSQRSTPPPGDAIAAALSPRELDVLRLLARGLSNTEIADRLALSHGTVRNYVSAILSKLDVSDRTQAALLAVRHGLVDPDAT
ncbi:MAG: response regulator transcription factor [Anaerolineae bacterium]|nr:response regulator transcription factor [Anaerolineae bacterium]